MSKKNPVGRPSIPEHLLKKRTTKTIRIPLEISDDLKTLSRLYGAGGVSKEEIRAFIKIKKKNIKKELRAC
jgi:hypothetical protein